MSVLFKGDTLGMSMWQWMAYSLEMKCLIITLSLIKCKNYIVTTKWKKQIGIHSEQIIFEKINLITHYYCTLLSRANFQSFMHTRLALCVDCFDKAVSHSRW